MVTKDKYAEIKFFLLGVIVFSPISSTITIQLLNFPFSLPEILLLPFLILLKNKIKTIKFKTTDLFTSLFIIFISVLFGLVYNEFSLYSMLSTARAWFYLIIFSIAFSRPNNITCNDLMYLAIGSILAWGIDAFYNAKNTTIGFNASYGVMLIFPILFSTIISKNKNFLLSLITLISLFLIVFSGLRRCIVVVVFSIFIPIFFSKFKFKQSIKRIVVIIIIGILIINIIPHLGNYLSELNTLQFNRIFTRTESIINNKELDSSDEGRWIFIVDIISNFLNYTIPRGMVSLQTGTETITGTFNDFPLYQIMWITGWPIALTIVIWILYLIIGNYKKFRYWSDTCSITNMNCLIIMLILLFLEGTFIIYPYAVPITGIIIGRSILNTRIPKKIIE